MSIEEDIKEEKLLYRLYYRFYMLCMKVGLIKFRSHTERHEDMVIMVLEPKWIWQK